MVRQDAATVAVLTAALSGFEGSIVVVTHNREFCEAIKPTHVAKVVIPSLDPSAIPCNLDPDSQPWASFNGSSR